MTPTTATVVTHGSDSASTPPSYGTGRSVRTARRHQRDDDQHDSEPDERPSATRGRSRSTGTSSRTRKKAPMTIRTRPAIRPPARSRRDRSLAPARGPGVVAGHRIGGAPGGVHVRRAVGPRPGRVGHDADRALRDDDRHHDVDEQGQAAGQDDQHRPDDPDDRWIEIEHLGEAAGDARQHPVVGRSIQAISHSRPRVQDERAGVRVCRQFDLTGGASSKPGVVQVEPSCSRPWSA